MSNQSEEIDARITRLRDSLHLLDEKEQLVLRLRFWDGFSCRQVAELLGEKRDAIRMRCYRAQARLCTLLTDHKP